MGKGQLGVSIKDRRAAGAATARDGGCAQTHSGRKTRPGGRAASGKASPAFVHDPLVRFGDVHTVMLWLPRKPQWSDVWSQPMPVGATQRPYSIVCICI